MTIKSNIAVSENGFLFNPVTGDSYSVNAIGQDIIQMMKSNTTEEIIIEKLLAEYRTDRATIEKDLNDFKNLLTYYKIAE